VKKAKPSKDANEASIVRTSHTGEYVTVGVFGGKIVIELSIWAGFQDAKNVTMNPPQARELIAALEYQLKKLNSETHDNQAR